MTDRPVYDPARDTQFHDLTLSHVLWEAEAKALRAENARLRPWAELARLCMEGWPEIGDIDGFSLHDWAVDCGVLREVPGGYDPLKHDDTEGVCPEPGEPWFEIAAFPRAALNTEGEG